MNTLPPPRRRRYGELPKHLLICLLLGLELFPLYMTVQVSLKDNALFVQNPWLPDAPGSWHWENWAFAVKLLLPYVAHSIFVAVLATVGQLTLALLGAYFFARQAMPFRRLLWAALMVLFMMPTVVNIVPLFGLLKRLALLNNLWALVLVGIAGGQAFSIYLLRNFIKDLPRDLFEAAEIDGASHWQQLVHVVIPMSLPIIGTLAILSFLGPWNDFLLALVVLRDPERFTIGVGLIYLDGEYVRRWGQIMAAFLFASLPLVVLFLFTMRWFVRGLTAGGWLATKVAATDGKFPLTLEKSGARFKHEAVRGVWHSSCVGLSRTWPPGGATG